MQYQYIPHCIVTYFCSLAALNKYTGCLAQPFIFSSSCKHLEYCSLEAKLFCASGYNTLLHMLINTYVYNTLYTCSVNIDYQAIMKTLENPTPGLPDWQRVTMNRVKCENTVINKNNCLLWSLSLIMEGWMCVCVCSRQKEREIVCVCGVLHAPRHFTV